ncbi:unnamed protein product [Cyclocybe aegerita]|uniref:Uncharacterized protein n=1 Tax=Cyclocybe aegerita TaxID=1973307 RepID=A0A8S0WPP9_CYCAE|nr:unnamed protein product [Cyclocybe aegerita]
MQVFVGAGQLRGPPNRALVVVEVVYSESVDSSGAARARSSGSGFGTGAANRAGSADADRPDQGFFIPDAMVSFRSHHGAQDFNYLPPLCRCSPTLGRSSLLVGTLALPYRTGHTLENSAPSPESRTVSTASMLFSSAGSSPRLSLFLSR